MLRQLAKTSLERLMLLTGGSPRRMAGRSLVLSYHNVVRDADQGQGDQSLHLPLSCLVRQLDLLQEHADVVSVAALLAGPPASDRPRVAITFDDAYRGAVDLGLPELQRRQLPATLFVAPGLLGARAMWWDELATPDGLSAEVRQTALQQQSGKGDAVLATFSTRLATTLPASYGCATEADLRRLVAGGYISLGAHTWNHPNLTRLEAGELALELQRPMEWLRGFGSSDALVLAYPYGLSDDNVARAAESAGYRAAFRVEGGWLPATMGALWQLPRLNIPAGLSEEGFLLRLAGRLVA